MLKRLVKKLREELNKMTRLEVIGITGFIILGALIGWMNTLLIQYTLELNQ